MKVICKQQPMSFHLKKILRRVASYGTWQVPQLPKVLHVFLHFKLQHPVKDNSHPVSSFYSCPYKYVHSQCTQAWFLLCHKQMCIYHVVVIVTCTFSLTRLTASPLYLPFSFTAPSFLCHCFNFPRTGFSNSFTVRPGSVLQPSLFILQIQSGLAEEAPPFGNVQPMLYI